MIKKIIAMVFVLITTSIFSQITLSTTLYIGKDTIRLKPGQTVTSIIDSINKVRLDKYYAERQRLEDSTEMAYISRCKKGPHLYFNTINDENRSFIEMEKDPEEVVKIIDSLKFQKIDSVITYSELAYEVIEKINSQRTQKIEIDSNRQEMLSEDMIITYFLKKDVAVLEKVISERCPTQCYEEVFRRIAKKKSLIKTLLTEDLDYINISIIKDRRSVIVFISYKQKNNKNNQYKIVYIQ
jgi:hypothetical protein